MGKAITVAMITFVLGILTEAYLGLRGDFRGIGIMLSVSLMGGFIIYFNEKKK